MATTSFSRTSGTPTNALKWTYSVWVKLSELIDGDRWLLDFNTDSNNRSQIGWTHDNSLPQLIVYEKVSSSTSQLFTTTQCFRDLGAFYNIVVSCDRTLATQEDRTKIYINGERVTDFHTTPNYPAQNVTGIINTAVDTLIGKYSQSTVYYDGLMSYVSFVDGTAYDASYFGETDSSSGIWKIKTVPSVTWGNNGFFLKMDTSSPGTDTSGNNNTFTASGTPTLTQDNASNNYNILSEVIYATSAGVTISNGGTSFNSGSSIDYAFAIPNFALSKGRWYFESKIGHTCAGLYIGDTIQIVEAVRNSTRIGVGSQQYSWECNGNFQNNNTQTSYGSTATAGDVIGMFVDLEDNKLYISVNGTLQNSGTGFACTDPASTQSGFYFVGGIADQCGATANVTADMNYGNGFFGTTAVSSSNADAAGYGLFEYSPNQGGAANFDGYAKNFYALNTKNINTYG